MTGIHRDSNTPTQCPSSSQLDTFDQPNEDTRSSNSPSHQHHQQYDTPRAKRFSQKLVEAAKKQPLARTPSTSASLSPPLESCMMDDNDYYDNDESMADTDPSCFASPNHDDQIMNNHFQNLLLSSPLRPELAMMRPLQLDKNSLPSAIPDDQSELNEVLNRRRLQDKRPVKQKSLSDSPSLSAKPKRRKLKQQRTTSWRTGADATLDTNKVHLPINPDQQRPPSSQTPTSPPLQPSQIGTTRRSSRLANRKVSYGKTVGIAYKKPLVFLGIPGGVKTESEPALLFDDGDYSGRNGTSGSSSSNEQYQQHYQPKPPRKIRRRVDTVEKRLNQLIFARDTLDLSQHSVLPTSGDKASSQSTQETPSVVVIDDSGNESDDPTPINPTTEQRLQQSDDIDEEQEVMEGGLETTANNDQAMDERERDSDSLLSKVKPEPVDENMGLSTTTPQTPLSTEIAMDQAAATKHHEDMDIDMDMAETEQPLTSETPPPQTDTTQHTKQDAPVDDDLIMADDRRLSPPRGDFASEDIIPSSSKVNDDHIANNNTIRAPSSCSPTPSPPELNDPLPPALTSLLSSSESNPSSTTTSLNDNDDNHIQPSSASTLTSSSTRNTTLSTSTSSASASLESTAAAAAASIPKTTDNTTTNASPFADTSHQSSQQANDMYTILTSDTTTTTKEGVGITSLTEDQNNAWTSSSSEQQQLPAELDDSTIGSSEGTTLLGRLIGSASHFFLGN